MQLNTHPRWILTALLSVAPMQLWAAPPLHEQIDQLIAARAGGPLAALSTDAEFLRRVQLDLAGVIPTSAEVRAFLDDRDPAKREKLIDRLLAGSDYPRRMQQAFGVMLLERREGAAISDREWNSYLRESFAANQPWDQFVRGLIAADGRETSNRAAIRFFMDGGRGDHHQMTQDVARLFLGRNIQCAQCHDHPNVDDYTQAEYFGLFAYLNQTKPHADPQDKKYLAEGAAVGKIDFQSVFVPTVKNATGPRLPGGQELEIPAFEKGQEFAEPAQNGLPAVPKFRPRSLLAENLTAGGNQHFVRNSVNRFWYLMLGRGLVHPLDQMHQGNPPSHPELLDLLAKEFVATGCDVKRLLREIALSETYQRGSLLPEGVEAREALPQSFRVANSKPLSAEQMLWSITRATGNLELLLKTPIPESSKFTHKDYVSGRIVELPDNLGDLSILFAATFGNPPGEAEVEFSPSVEHSLFLANERLIRHWLQPREENLAARMAKLTDASAIAEELYLSLLSRLPEEPERAEVAAYLEKHQARRDAAQRDLAWGLLTSAEFRLNH